MMDNVVVGTHVKNYSISYDYILKCSKCSKLVKYFVDKHINGTLVNSKNFFIFLHERADHDEGL